MKRLMNKCNRAYKKACCSGKGVHLTKYKRLRNITTKRLGVAHDNDLNDVMGGQSFWRLSLRLRMLALIESNVFGRT